MIADYKVIIFIFYIKIFSLKLIGLCHDCPIKVDKLVFEI